MDFELSEEHQLAYDSAFAFARDEIRPHNAEIERTDDFPRWMWKRLADQGYTGIAIPEEYGGSERRFLDGGTGGAWNWSGQWGHCDVFRCPFEFVCAQYSAQWD